MQWSWKLGRFAGIDTYVHASFLLLVGWAAWASWSGASSLLSVVFGVGFLLAVFGSVLLHEYGHALVARRFGIATRRIVLYPIGGVAQLEGMPRKPRQELAVALAGPAVNFAIAAGLWVLSPMFGAGLLGSLMGSLMIANLTLGLFNLVPAFPMDGGRALRAFLAERVGSRRATETAAKIGKWVAAAMAIYGLFFGGPTMLVFIAAFVWFAANAELRSARHHGYPDEVEVLGGPRGGWAHRIDPWDLRPTARSRTNRWADPGAPRPVRVVVVRRTGWL